MSGRLIAHQIKKAKLAHEADVTCRDLLIPSGDDLAGSFMQELRTAVTGRNPVAGRFLRPVGAQLPFEQRLRRYLAPGTDAEFVNFTKDATELLAAKMRSESFATGGYVVFAEYAHSEDQFLQVALLSTKAEPSFDAALNLVPSVTLDFAHLRYAGRIRYNGLPENEDGVVHFVSRRQDEVSDYFREFLGCEPATDSAIQGRHLFSALRGFADGQQLSREQKEEMMQQTYSYWSDCRRAGRPMAMTALANRIRPEDPHIVMRHFENVTALAGEFPAPPSSVMRQFVKFAFNRQGLKLEFDRGDWLDKIGVRNGSITIRQAPAELIRSIEEEKSGNT